MERIQTYSFAPEEIKLYQEARLTETLAYLQAHSPLLSANVQRTFHRHYSNQKIEDLQQIPLPPKQTCNYIIVNSSV